MSQINFAVYPKLVTVLKGMCLLSAMLVVASAFLFSYQKTLMINQSSLVSHDYELQTQLKKQAELHKVQLDNQNHQLKTRAYFEQQYAVRKTLNERINFLVSKLPSSFELKQLQITESAIKIIGSLLTKDKLTNWPSNSSLQLGQPQISISKMANDVNRLIMDIYVPVHN